MKKILLLSIFTLLSSFNFYAINQDNEDEEKKDNLQLSSFKFRSIGPALMSGRISDIIIHPENENIWYVTAGSGGVWKTENAGTTWNPIFDHQVSYSIGCISFDPKNPETIWVGTGENVGGRHVGYGDGVYVSKDGGKSWNHMGLSKSEHISKILIHPENSNIIWVAAQGPLWSKGGERGIYKSVDGGISWVKTLGDSLWVGATDVILNPKNPNVLYAATWQRHRTVAGYLSGGVGSGIYKSEDGGESWRKLTNGLPTSKMGKIGIAISPQKTNVIYAAIELDRRKGGFYRSDNHGSSWSKMSDAVSGGTGPHYYQEIFASPHKFDEVYLVDNYMQVTFDGGKNFSRMNEKEKHVDNHAIAFKKDDPNYILIGCDGGIYESFDKTINWKFINNLPLTQFYKIAVDDEKPFYNIYGGTQDNNTQGAPSRTDNIHGIRNSDWYIVLGGDGHQPATEPNNPNIVYAQWQRGNLNRHNKTTGENTNIKPVPRLGEPNERFNWDAPIIVSPHKEERIYFASQRVWKSENRGDSWEPISNDLTNNIERISTKYYDSYQTWDNAWDLYAMSNYSTITSLSESPVKEGLIYIGTDDGVIQITEDGGNNWNRIHFDKFKGLPKFAFVNDIKADLFDENTVYVVFDNHKYGDFKPYIYKSSNKGKTWKKIINDLPERTILWRVIQDHINKNLMFLATEFGIYMTQDGGESWLKMNGGLPNISFRDLAIQKRENDLVAASFGRGIYILDDYSALRESTNIIENEKKYRAKLFKPRNGLWYFPKRILGSSRKASQGDNFFVADNPPFGVEITYFLSEKYQTLKELRTDSEKKKSNKRFEGWETLEKEKNEIEPEVWLFVSDQEKNIIKKIKAENKSGYNRINWDLSTESKLSISLSEDKKRKGPMTGPGKYHSQLFSQINGVFQPISNLAEINLIPLHSTNTNNSFLEAVSFWQKIDLTKANLYDLSDKINLQEKRIKTYMTAYEKASKTNIKLNKLLSKLRNSNIELKKKMNGSKVRSEVGEQNEFPTIWTYLWSASGSSRSTDGPSEHHIKSLEFTNELYIDIKSKFDSINELLNKAKKDLSNIGAPNINEF